MPDASWNHLLSLTQRISREFPDAVFIGGVAVAQYAKQRNPILEEASHDADLYLSLLGKNEMRDRYEVLRNERLGKDSVLVDGEDFDLYIERQHRLAVPYDQIRANSTTINDIRVASLEHLLILKLDAAADRLGSAKGDKDQRDIARIVMLLEHPRPSLLKQHLDERRLRTLQSVARQRDIFQRMGLGAHEAAAMRRILDKHTTTIVNSISERENDGLSL
jgi:hypothetical protein